jgi:hypothetical protein
MTTPGQPLPGTQDAKAQARDFQTGQAILAALLIRDVIGLFLGLGTRDVRMSWPPLRDAIARLIRERFNLSAALGAAFYGEARQLANAPGHFDASIPPVPSDLRILGTLDATGPYSMLKSIGNGTPVGQALQDAAVRVSGAASYLALEGARELITQSVQQDPEALAWMRETTSGRPCSFCAMLESRGAVYKTAISAGFEAHNHCQCVPVPVFDKDTIKLLRDSDLALQWKKVTKGLSGRDARNAWRRWWDKAGREAA